MEPGDCVGILTTSCRVLVDLTNDRSKLHEAIMRLELHPRRSCQVSPSKGFNMGLVRSALAEMSGLTGRRDIIIVSTGLAEGYDRSPEKEDLIDLAIRSKVVIHAVDVTETTETTYQGAGSPHEGEPFDRMETRHASGRIVR
jgi:hypothetical protein